MRRRYDFIYVPDLNIQLFEFFGILLLMTSMKSNNCPSLLLWIVIAFFVNVRRSRL